VSSHRIATSSSRFFFHLLYIYVHERAIFACNVHHRYFVRDIRISIYYYAILFSSTYTSRFLGFSFFSFLDYFLFNFHFFYILYYILFYDSLCVSVCARARIYISKQNYFIMHLAYICKTLLNSYLIVEIKNLHVHMYILL